MRTGISVAWRAGMGDAGEAMAPINRVNGVFVWPRYGNRLAEAWNSLDTVFKGLLEYINRLGGI